VVFITQALLILPFITALFFATALACLVACCAAASEAECAGVFCNGQVVVDERAILSSLGHPQHTTIIFCDNECAVGLAES
jgi:hypothetical protein